MIAAPALIEALAGEGWYVQRDAWTAQDCAALLAELREHDAAGRLQPAGTGRGAGRAVRAELRGDRILWLDTHDGGPATRGFLAGMQALGREINAALHLGIAEYEAHFAVYPPGGRYVRHLDRHRDSDARLVSTVLYLNPEWDESAGGTLHLWTTQAHSVEVVPRAGTLVTFLSASIAHEVQAATRERFSIAGWFRRRAALPF